MSNKRQEEGSSPTLFNTKILLARETPSESVEYFRETKGSQERAKEKRIKAWRRQLGLGMEFARYFGWLGMANKRQEEGSPSTLVNKSNAGSRNTR